jgi:hypothetical protein
MIHESELEMFLPPSPSFFCSEAYGVVGPKVWWNKLLYLSKMADIYIYIYITKIELMMNYEYAASMPRLGIPLIKLNSSKLFFFFFTKIELMIYNNAL